MVIQTLGGFGNLPYLGQVSYLTECFLNDLSISKVCHQETAYLGLTCWSPTGLHLEIPARKCHFYMDSLLPSSNPI